MRKKKKMFIGQSVAMIFLSCSLLASCGSKSVPAQGTGTESTPAAETSSATESVSVVETPEPSVEFPNKPVVDEADIFWSGSYHGINCLVSNDGLLVVTGIWEEDDKWNVIWEKMQFKYPPNTSISSVTSAYVDVRNVTELNGLFHIDPNGSSLISCDLSDLDTSNVTDMSFMFSGCRDLTSVDLSGLDTSNVTNMSGMFSNCESLTSVDLSGLDLSNVTDMTRMFNFCSGLTSVNLGGLDMSSMDAGAILGMFTYCQNLTDIYVSSSWPLQEEMRLYDEVINVHIMSEE